LEEVVVTASLKEGGYNEMPAITLRHKADFLVQSVRFVNDSRSPDLRRQEIIDSIAKFIQSARKEKGIELSYGEGFLLPVDLTDDSLEIINDRQRVDTSRVDVYVKSAVVASGSVKDQITRLRAFIAEQKLVGRTEIERIGDIGLSIVGPEQYRYDILKNITQENDRIRTIVGTACSIAVSGLERRVSWERTSVDELTLYIPYRTETKCGD
jgi:hypothetical protein